jgi:hypothetical protein
MRRVRSRRALRRGLRAATPLDPIVLVPSAAMTLGFLLGAIHGAGAPTADLSPDRLTAALRLGASWSAGLGVGGACAGMLLSAVLLLAGWRIDRPRLLAGLGSISIFLVLLEAGILLYGHAVSECYAFPQVLGVFGILLLGYAVALGTYLVVVTSLRRRARTGRAAVGRQWFLPDAASLN